MIFEHEFIDLANTASISNISTRGQPITSTLCKKDIKGSIKSAISENPSFKQFLEENNAYGRYVKNVTNQILRSRDITDKLIRCVHRIAHSNYSNKEIINGTISWSSTSEGSDYWFGLYVNTKK
ncbi:MAG: hypothetical protein UC703_10155 [Bacilli bacterium]|jgi:hypothetical protein|nr:hypothetical protein [Bacilli bacterium]